MTYSDNDKRSNSSTEPFIAAPRANKEKIPLCDIKSLDYLAEEILHTMRFSGYCYNENGEHLFPREDELHALIEEYANSIKENILEFRECTVFRELSMHINGEGYTRRHLEKADAQTTDYISCDGMLLVW